MGQLHTALVGDCKGTAGPNQSWAYNTGTRTWQNTTGYDIYIKRAWVLMGVQGGISAHDFSVNVWVDDHDLGGISQIVNENTTVSDDCTLKWESASDYYKVPNGEVVYWSSYATLYDPNVTQPKLLQCTVRIGFTINSP